MSLDRVVNVVVIPVEGEITVQEWPVDDLAARTRAVIGGWLQGLGLQHDHLVAPGHMIYLNEEGKPWLLNLPVNPRASDLVHGTVTPGEEVRGDVVLVGPGDEEGDETSVHPNVIAALLAP